MGVLVGGVVIRSTFLTWMHIYFISFDRINTVFFQSVFYFNSFSWNIDVIKYRNLFKLVNCTLFIRPWFKYRAPRTSSILLCLHGAYRLNSVCTWKFFSGSVIFSKLALFIIISLSINISVLKKCFFFRRVSFALSIFLKSWIFGQFCWFWLFHAPHLKIS